MTESYCRAGLATALIVLSLGGCSEPGEGGNGDPDSGTGLCGAGLKSVGPACVPLFDTCQDGEIPLPGGGCKRVGVKECPGGLMGPPDWTCKPVGPPVPCLSGWALVAGGWCEPLLPKGPCPAGTMEVLGQSTCQPMGDCGSGTWGNLKTSASTLFVDQGHKGSSSKGTKGEPYLTIGDALKSAGAGAHIAVAAGTYLESLTIRRKVILEGRCPQQVILKVGVVSPVVQLKDWANGAVLRGLTITGAGVGVTAEGVAFTGERLAVLGCGQRGIELYPGASMTLRHSLVAGNRVDGIVLGSATATLERTVVRDSLPRSTDNAYGAGIEALHWGGQPSQLTLRDCLISGNRTAGISLYSAKALVERTVVRDTREQLANKEGGRGFQVSIQPGKTLQPELTLRDSVISGNLDSGLFLVSAKALVERTVVRDTRASMVDQANGVGIQAGVQSTLSPPSELTVRQCLIKGNRYNGIRLASSKGVVERTVVRDTRPQLMDNRGGSGIQAYIQPGQTRGATLTVKDSVVAGNRNFGVGLFSSVGTIERTVIRDTQEEASSKLSGSGIVAQLQDSASPPSQLTVRDSLLARNRYIGLILFGSKGVVERTVVRDTREQVSDRIYGIGVVASVQPGLSPSADLVLRDCWIKGNRTVGVNVLNSKALVERTVVRDTLNQVSNKIGGSGIEAFVLKGHSQSPELMVLDSFVVNNTNAGIGFGSGKGKLERSIIADTRADPSGHYGDGVTFGEKTTIDVKDVQVEGNARAGLLFVGARGTVQRSLIQGNVFAIDLEEGASPTIGAGNRIVNNQINKVTSGRGLSAAPVPPPPTLPGNDAGSPAGADAGMPAH